MGGMSNATGDELAATTGQTGGRAGGIINQFQRSQTGFDCQQLFFEILILIDKLLNLLVLLGVQCPQHVT